MREKSGWGKFVDYMNELNEFSNPRIQPGENRSDEYIAERAPLIPLTGDALLNQMMEGARESGELSPQELSEMREEAFPFRLFAETLQRYKQGIPSPVDNDDSAASRLASLEVAFQGMVAAMEGDDAEAYEFAVGIAGQLDAVAGMVRAGTLIKRHDHARKLYEDSIAPKPVLDLESLSAPEIKDMEGRAIETVLRSVDRLMQQRATRALLDVDAPSFADQREAMLPILQQLTQAYLGYRTARPYLDQDGQYIQQDTHAVCIGSAYAALASGFGKHTADALTKQVVASLDGALSERFPDRPF